MQNLVGMRNLVLAISVIAIGACSPNIAKLGERCRSADAKACDQLVTIARTHKEPSFRLVAVNQLRDTATLLSLAAEAEGPDADPFCAAAVNRVEDQAAIARFVSEFQTHLYVMRGGGGFLCYELALGKITDMEVLLPLLASLEAVPCCSRLDRLDQQSLARLAKMDSKDVREGVPLGATKRLTDQSLLLSVAMEPNVSKSVQLTAVRTITDVTMLQGLLKDPTLGKAAKAQLDEIEWRTAHPAPR